MDYVLGRVTNDPEAMNYQIQARWFCVELDGGFIGEIEEIPDSICFGRTLKEVKEKTLTRKNEYLQALRESGDTFPKPRPENIGEPICIGDPYSEEEIEVHPLKETIFHFWDERRKNNGVFSEEKRMTKSAEHYQKMKERNRLENIYLKAE